MPETRVFPGTQEVSAHTTSSSTTAGTTAVSSAEHVEGPFLVATDGEEAAESVMTVASLLAGPAEVEIVAVVEPAPPVGPPSQLLTQVADADEARAQALWQRLSRQAGDVFGSPSPRLRVVIGSPVEMLARVARERRARMVITGLRPHGRLERLMLHRETPIGVADAARTPVLVVPRGMTSLPRTALIAADAGTASVNAARRARPLLGQVKKVYVIHVTGSGSEPSPEDTWMSGHSHDHSATHAFERILKALDLPAGVSIETRSIPGDPVDELLDFAEFARVDLTVAGYHHRLPLERLIGPRSVAEGVFRGTTCAMLLVPEIAGAELPFLSGEEHEVLADRPAWPQRLRSFSYRNAGRPVTLDIDTPQNSAQAQLRGYRFVSAALESDAIRLMLAGADGAILQVTHSIPHADSVEIQHLAGGRDVALRVAHDGGYSVLTFHDSPTMSPSG